jgi:hypothetical protein
VDPSQQTLTEIRAATPANPVGCITLSSQPPGMRMQIEYSLAHPGRFYQPKSATDSIGPH